MTGLSAQQTPCTWQRVGEHSGMPNRSTLCKFFRSGRPPANEEGARLFHHSRLAHDRRYHTFPHSPANCFSPSSSGSKPLLTTSLNRSSTRSDSTALLHSRTTAEDGFRLIPEKSLFTEKGYSYSSNRFMAEPLWTHAFTLSLMENRLINCLCYN